MEQEVAHSRAGCNSRRALKLSGEMTSMFHHNIKDGSWLLRFRMLSGAPEWMDSLSGAPELMDSHCRMLATLLSTTLYMDARIGG